MNECLLVQTLVKIICLRKDEMKFKKGYELFHIKIHFF
jgi:hypothetical protein